MTKCTHIVRLRARGDQFLDSNIIMLAVEAYCERCGATFRAVGVASGVNPDAPGLTDDGERVVFPLVPIGEEPERVGRC